jgi:tripartite-type tricarboxylate transporter receptor subunit TctC
MISKLARAVVLLPLLWGFAASAQQFPSKPVTFVVPVAGGGQTDILIRRLAEELRKEWGQPVLVENKPGASTIIGAAYVARAPADGYTILVANDPTLSSNQFLHLKLSYDPDKDFALVLNMVDSTSILVTEASFPANTVPELIALAKQKPGALTYASFGARGKTHIDTEALALQTGTKFTHVPYRGAGPVMVALLGKQIDFAFSGILSALGAIRDGKIKALGIAGPQRSPVLPNVPTFAEAGVPFNSRAWYGLIVPAGTPQAVIDKIARDTSKVITDPEFLRKNIVGAGFGLLNQGPKEFAAYLTKDRAEYESRIKNAGMKPE